MACQKKPQEDGQGGEGGTAYNIGGEVGSIPPYPTFIPPGPKKLFCLNGLKVTVILLKKETGSEFTPNKTSKN